jgi:hypothetical protein
VQSKHTGYSSLQGTDHSGIHPLAGLDDLILVRRDVGGQAWRLDPPSGANPAGETKSVKSAQDMRGPDPLSASI